MPRNQVFKQICRITLTGDDIINSLTTDSYSTKGSTVKNAVKMRFNLNGSLNHLRLSSNARAIVETCNIQSIQFLAGKYVLLRIVSSSNDICFDTKAFLNGNPILLSMPTNSTVGTNNFIFNCSEFFYNINIPQNFLQNGYIDLQLECPTQTTNNDIAWSLTNLNSFFLTLIIIDEDPEITNNNLLNPSDSNNNIHSQIPIRIPY